MIVVGDAEGFITMVDRSFSVVVSFPAFDTSVLFLHQLKYNYIYYIFFFY